MIPVFVGCEVMSEHEADDKSMHTIERRCKLNVDAPRLLKRVRYFCACLSCLQFLKNWCPYFKQCTVKLLKYILYTSTYICKR